MRTYGGKAVKAAPLIRALDAQDGPRLLPFQRNWLGAAFGNGLDMGVLSAPRGSGKTWLLGRLAALAMSPGSPIYHEGDEVIAVSASIEMGKLLARAANEVLPDGYLRWTGLAGGGHRVVGVAPDGCSIRVISGSGKRAMGLGARNRLILGDEPGSWERRSGALLYEALRGALGKVAGSKLLLIGTKSPAHPGDWWPLLLDAGSGPGSHVTILGRSRGRGLGRLRDDLAGEPGNQSVRIAAPRGAPGAGRSPSASLAATRLRGVAPQSPSPARAGTAAYGR